MKFWGEPGDRVNESNNFCFYGGKLFEGSRQRVIVDVEVQGGWVSRASELGESV